MFQKERCDRKSTRSYDQIDMNAVRVCTECGSHLDCKRTSRPSPIIGLQCWSFEPKKNFATAKA